MIRIIQRRFRKSRRNMSSGEDIGIQRSRNSQDAQHPDFPHFSELTDDICRIIISYVADAPHESEVRNMRVTRYHPATMTSIFPYVNKTFQRLSDDDENWKAALLRQLANDERENVWKSGLRRMLPLDYSVDDESKLLNDVLSHLQGSLSYKEIYKKIFTRHLKFDAPMFLMPCSVTLGEMYGLHLFEPRYRRMIRDLMDACEDPQAARNGEPIRPGVTHDGLLQPPLVIHFCLPQHLRKGAIAALVQVVWCRTYEQETADVQLMPISWVKIDDIWCRRDQGDLFYAHATRL
jgi:hypothetical protein